MVHFYLCKDGVGIQMAPITKDAESVFLLKEVKKKQSGKYSCVYSICKHPISQVKSTGDYLVLRINGDEDVEASSKTPVSTPPTVFKERPENEGAEGILGFNSTVALVLLILSLSVLILLWRYLGILKQMISKYHGSSEIQDMGQTYNVLSSVPVDETTEVCLDVEEEAYSMIDDWRGLRPSVTQSSQIDPTREEAKCSSLETTVEKPKRQVETAIYAQVIKTKKKENDPVCSFLMEK
ncbi:uncharacterized protein LOC117592952 [Esox lucius]|uniref:uncharacterized protein LOC117592952 n=1 Tax=Esox lucius TaxID=8010 RepID=UPI00097344A8|nr:uncharacterized protein LOC117592952 [Esox lucius]